MKLAEKKQITVRIIESYIRDIEVNGNGFSDVDKYDAVVNLATHIGLITPKERAAFDARVDKVYP